MDPTTAIPLHFTFETLFLSAAGLVLAWCGLRRVWPAAASALLLVVAQGLHAGRFVEQDDDPALLVMRLVALVGIAVFALPVGAEPRLLGAGLLVLAGGTIWSAVATRAGVDLSVAPHTLFFVGSIVLLVWVWRATRQSVRMRVLAAFVAVLAVTVVVAGGAVARVAAVNSRDEQFARLARAATAVREIAVDARDEVRGRAAALSPTVSAALSGRRSPPLDASRLADGEWAVVADRTSDVVSRVASDGTMIPYSDDDVSRLDVVRTVEASTQSTSDVVDDSLQVIGGAPVFRPGGRRVASDVIGVVVVGRAFAVEELGNAADGVGIELALVDGEDRAATRGAPSRSPDLRAPTDAVALASTDDSLSAAVALPDSGVRIAVTSGADGVAVAATELVRAFLVAILAAALLAVVAALWLSARIARPMLDLADEAERVKSDFLANVSHELRTPLTPIRGYTDLLRRGRVPQRDASGYLDEIGVAAQRLERIVSLLLDVAAIEAGRLWVDAGDVAPAALLQEAGARWSPRSRTHTIEVRTPSSLPDVHADASLISRVLDELIDNALKFSVGGRITLEAQPFDASVEFRVSDEGPGIDPERLAALRSAFSQAESGDTRRFGGLGLGLAFAEGVLDKHGARLEITSSLGEGTTCSFALPATSSVTPMRSRASSKRGRPSRVGTVRRQGARGVS